MIDLHDSYGKQIANFVNGQLHDTQVRNIGNYGNIGSCSYGGFSGVTIKQVR